jgi:HEAT repeat protein/thiol-disulfide isomerase/thioredoxin
VRGNAAEYGLLPKLLVTLLAFVLVLWFMPGALAADSSTNTPGPAAKPTLHADLKIATEAAAADQSLVLVVFSATWCAPCKALEKTTLSSPEFLESPGALHVTDIDADANQKLARDFGVQALPTLLLLTGDQKIVARREGFVTATELNLWIAEGRQRVKDGKWEGTAASGKLAELVSKAAADRLTDADLKRLVAALDERDPAERAVAGRLLLAQREAAMPLLIAALGDAYLGRRVAAGDLLRTLAPAAPEVDAWQSPDELKPSLAALQKWWADTGRLPPANAPRPVDASVAGSIKAAVEALLGDDPVARTEAMSTLSAHGPAALPALREAIQQSERSASHRSTALLEDVRWAVLVPDAVETRAGGVRAVLARGTSTERQAAAVRLGKGGREAIPALGELVNDPDPLVVESAVRGLSQIGGEDSIPAMQALLKAADSNLRMTAAQALGRTKSTNAVPAILSILADENEVVVCTALSALEELNATRSGSPSKAAQPPEVTDAVKRCFADPRWRVRAAAAEVAGKLSMKPLVPALRTLLEDADGFVVKNAMNALRQMSSAPAPDKLAAIARRHAGLRVEATEMLVSSGGPEAAQLALEIYTGGSESERVAVLEAMAESGAQNDAAWTGLLGQAVKETSPKLRGAAARALVKLPPKEAAALVGPLLADDDAETRRNAAGVVFWLVTDQRPASANRYQGISSFSSFDDSFDLPTPLLNQAAARPKTNQPPAVTAEQIAGWHRTLKEKAGGQPELRLAATIYVTGNSNAELPMLAGALERADAAALREFARAQLAGALLVRLPWPAGRPVVDLLARSPLLYAEALGARPPVAKAVREHLLEPARFRAAMEPATMEDLQVIMPQMLRDAGQPGSLLADNASARAVVTGLLDSTNPVWRAAAVFVVARRADATQRGALEAAAKDTNAWVRLAALSGLGALTKKRAELEAIFAPLLTNTNRELRSLAMMKLIEPETLQAASMALGADYFRFDQISAFNYSSYTTSSEDRPLAVLETKPVFLATVRAELARATGDDAALPALLLAQYGDFSGLDRLMTLAADDRDAESQATRALLAGIALSRDAKYLPEIRKALGRMENEYEIRSLLTVLKGFSGPEARALRLEINQRLRRGTE